MRWTSQRDEVISEEMVLLCAMGELHKLRKVLFAVCAVAPAGFSA
jgi:hypothetical protein